MAAEQVGSPRDLYERPANEFVAQFIGSPKMNVVPCGAEGETFMLPGHGSGRFAGAATGKTPRKLGIRPEHISVAEPSRGHCAGIVEVSEYLGSDTFIYVSAGDLGTFTVRHVGDIGVRAGETVGLAFDEARTHFFDDQGLAIHA